MAALSFRLRFIRPTARLYIRSHSPPPPIPEKTQGGISILSATPQEMELVYLGSWYDWHYYVVYLYSGETGWITVEAEALHCWENDVECSDYNMFDLYMRDDGVPTESLYDKKSVSAGSQESATHYNVNSGWYYIGIKRLGSKYGWYTIKITTSGGEKSTKEVFLYLNPDIHPHYFTHYVPDEMRSITGETDGKSGGNLLDLYMKDDGLPSTSDYDVASVTESEDEFARDYYPNSGWYYAMVKQNTGEGYFSFWFNLPPYWSKNTQNTQSHERRVHTNS